jgi:hypothetical protein
MSMLAGFLVALSLAQPMAPGGPMDQPPVIAEATAVRATYEEGASLTFDDELSGLKPVFEDMEDYNTFTLEGQDSTELAQETEVSLRLNTLYKLYITQLQMAMPPSQGAPARVVFDARVGLRQGGQEVNALSGRGEAPVGQTVIFQDLPMGKDKLIVLVRFRQDQEGDSSDQSQQQQQQQQQQNEDESDSQQNQEQQQQQSGQQDQESDQEEEQEEQDQQQQQQSGDQGEDQQDQQPQPTQPESDGENAKDPQHGEATNIEALLESLEEVDRREQELEQQSRLPSRIKGEWW